MKKNSSLLHLLSLQLPSPGISAVIISRPFSYTLTYINMLFAFYITGIIPYVLAYSLHFALNILRGFFPVIAHVDLSPILPLLNFCTLLHRMDIPYFI